MGCIGFLNKTIKEPSSLSNFQEKNYLNYFGVFWGLMALASPPSWMGMKGHKIQVGPKRVFEGACSRLVPEAIKPMLGQVNSCRGNHGFFSKILGPDGLGKPPNLDGDERP